MCLQNQCSCDNGVAAEGVLCLNDGAAKCISCNDGMLAELCACKTSAPVLMAWEQEVRIVQNHGDAYCRECESGTF